MGGLPDERRAKSPANRCGKDHTERFSPPRRRLHSMRLIALLRRTRHWQRRCSALLMLVLQVGVAAAPLAERESGQRVSHAEQPGTRHAPMHNESACVVCAVRSLRAVASQAAMALPLGAAPQRTPVAYVDVLTSRDPPSSNSSRAPPRLG